MKSKKTRNSLKAKTKPDSTIKPNTHEQINYSLTSQKMKVELSSLQDKINNLEEKLQHHQTERLIRENSMHLFNTFRDSTDSILNQGTRRNTFVHNTQRVSRKENMPKSVVLSNPDNFIKSVVKKYKKSIANKDNAAELKKEVKKWKGKYTTLKEYCTKLKADYKDLNANYKVSESLRKQQQQLIADLKAGAAKKSKKVKHSYNLKQPANHFFLLS
eukprot:TRINITY_DN1011_c0_g1_i1.p3 TRINITY_DN1011_c0_g1~~TRINITY_DN1011_c0_g1_i1.p3  ORF type:complete len:244 (+),score=31.61 TRINITY_DN1011_c0_g1_i1:85-732(+)